MNPFSSLPEKATTAPLQEQNFLPEAPIISYLNRNLAYPRSEWPKSWQPPTIEKKETMLPKPLVNNIAPLQEQNFLQETPIISYLDRNRSYPRSEWPKSWQPPSTKSMEIKKTILPKKQEMGHT